MFFSDIRRQRSRRILFGRSE